jgi:hypothetical protein
MIRKKCEEQITIIDNKLTKECMKITGIKTLHHLIDYTLRNLLRYKNQQKILELKGKINWKGNLSDWRKGRFSE